MLAYRQAHAKQVLQMFLGMKHAAAYIIPKLQNFVQEMFAPDLLKNVTTCNELWVYGYDIETKAQSFHWKCPEMQRPKKARQVR